jgi:hypothetical protein
MRAWFFTDQSRLGSSDRSAASHRRSSKASARSGSNQRTSTSPDGGIGERPCRWSQTAFLINPAPIQQSVKRSEWTKPSARHRNGSHIRIIRSVDARSTMQGSGICRASTRASNLWASTYCLRSRASACRRADGTRPETPTIAMRLPRIPTAARAGEESSAECRYPPPSDSCRASLRPALSTRAGISTGAGSFPPGLAFPPGWQFSTRAGISTGLAVFHQGWHFHRGWQFSTGLALSAFQDSSAVTELFPHALRPNPA